mmetsp:Transcript_26549/g.69297  ORF Transcript_26549/g.69297 Transcript_26549/m.69297 type:complete len:127 (-) Transcript_26549:117-497(-)
MMAAKPGSAPELISQLQSAEQKAKDIIEAAKKERVKKLRQATQAAEDDLKSFREEQQKLHEAKENSTQDNDAIRQLQQKTRAEIDEVREDYEKNKDKTIKYVVEKVLDVPTTLTDTQTMSLRVGSV